MMMTDKMKEEFEKCWLECGDCEVDDIYSTNEYEVFKFAWKASRAAQCVELPKQWFDDGLECDLMVANRVLDALDDAGVRYK